MLATALLSFCERSTCPGADRGPLVHPNTQSACGHRSLATVEVSRSHGPPNEAARPRSRSRLPDARLRFPHPPSAASPWQSRPRTMVMQEPATMRVDPISTTHPEGFAAATGTPWNMLEPTERSLMSQRVGFSPPARQARRLATPTGVPHHGFLPDRGHSVSGK